MKHSPARAPKPARRSGDAKVSRRGWWCFVVLLAGITSWVGVERFRSPQGLERAALPSRPVAPPAPHPPLPAPAPSSYLNTRSPAQYVGTARCVDCHPGEHATYLRTGHSRSLAHVDPAAEPPDGDLYHALSGRHYRAYRQHGSLRHQERLAATGAAWSPQTDHRLAYLVGSGRFARTYLVEDDGFLVESPLTWYAALQRWDMSPGYNQPLHRSFLRTVSADCLFCHAGAVQPASDQSERVKLAELAIGCERCHGPGSLHVDRQTTGQSPPHESPDLTIVNPTHLPRELAEAVCYQCHLTSVVQVPLPGRRPADFRPGLRWQDFAVDYAFQRPASEMTVTGHVDQLRQSRCYTESGTLTCTTCHDVHAASEGESSPALHRTRCLHCHEVQSCGLTEPARISQNQDDCLACHMPRAATEVPHLAFTHHRIGIHESTGPAADTDDFRPFAPVLDISHVPEPIRQELLGLAYLQYYRDHAQERGAQRYLEASSSLLTGADLNGPLRAPLALAQAEFAGARGDGSAAEQWAREALQADVLLPIERAGALRWLAGVALSEQRLADAQAALTQLVAIARDPRDWLLLGICRQRQGDVAGAIAAFERVLELDPTQPETYELLAPLYHLQGRSDRERQVRQQAAELRIRKTGKTSP